MSANDYKMPFVLRYLWERRNKLVSESKKLEYVLNKYGESEFVNDYTLQGMLREIQEFDWAIFLVEHTNVFSIAKYHAIGFAGLYQHNGIQLTKEQLKEYYELALKDITEENSIQKSEQEYDKILKPEEDENE